MQYRVRFVADAGFIGFVGLVNGRWRFVVVPCFGLGCNRLQGLPGLIESPHRIAATLSAAAAVLGGERAAAVCRELTKAFEEFRRGSLADLAAHFAANPQVKGEIVLVIGPPAEEAAPEDADVDALLSTLSRDMPAGKAATEAARQTGLPRRDLYRRLLEMKAGDGD